MRRKKERTPEPAIYPVITDSPGQTLGQASPRPRAMPSPARHLELQVISARFWRRQKGNPEPIITLEKCKLHLGWDDLQPNEGLSVQANREGRKELSFCSSAPHPAAAPSPGQRSPSRGLCCHRMGSAAKRNSGSVAAGLRSEAAERKIMYALREQLHCSAHTQRDCCWL